MTELNYENSIRKDIENLVLDRVRRRFPFGFVSKYLSNINIRMAGNSLNASTPNDYDLFSGEYDAFDGLEFGDDVKVLKETKNATTLVYEDKIIQLCQYHHESLEDLVESFDFAHIKLGVEFDSNNSLEKVYISDDWYKARLKEETYFTGSEYPLSSLFRSLKYKERGCFSATSFKVEVIKILTAIFERRVSSYEDFKDQLDAIDLQLKEEDGFDCETLDRYFNVILKP